MWFWNDVSVVKFSLQIKQPLEVKKKLGSFSLVKLISWIKNDCSLTNLGGSLIAGLSTGKKQKIIIFSF